MKIDALCIYHRVGPPAPPINKQMIKNKIRTAVLLFRMRMRLSSDPAVGSVCVSQQTAGTGSDSPRCLQPPMPGISSTAPRYENWDMDHLDHYQHYFYDDHDPDEDFFKSTAPSEDIWKKFELVPTPPMSPIRAVEGSGRVGLLYPSLGDKLEWVSQFLGQEDEQQQQQDVPCKLATTGDSFGNLSSIIIQDCMWSGFSAGQQLERVVGERYSACPGTGVAAKVAAGSAVTSPGRVQSGPGDTVAHGGLAADCVDPTAVLTFPITGGCKKQVSSGSESQSDSSGQ